MDEIRNTTGAAEEQEQAPPKVSALIVSHDDAPALRRCLQALENSKNRSELEILVVDNGSRDECAQMDSEFPSITMLRLPRYFGVTKAMNIGTRTAAGEYIFFLQPETEVAPDVVSLLAARLESDSSASAVCPLLVDEEGRPVPFLHPWPTRATLVQAWRRNGDLDFVTPNLDADAVPVEYAGRAAIMVRKQFVKGMNYFDERYGEFWADAELAFQIRRSQKKTLLLPAARARHYSVPRIEDYPSAARALLSADCASGIATYISKHNGFFSGLVFRLSAALSALGAALASLLTFRDTGYHWSRFFAIVSWQRIDGSQTAL
ncbi:MAG TPA: glycosyltransferase [Bryobacteraceae bacterium]|nr:glycosyltransferase [Bryobacteraceae bacterium]